MIYIYQHVRVNSFWKKKYGYAFVFYTYIWMPHNMIIFYFRLSYFHVSHSVVFSTKYFSTPIYIDVVLTLSITSFLKLWRYSELQSFLINVRTYQHLFHISKTMIAGGLVTKRAWVSLARILYVKSLKCYVKKWHHYSNIESYRIYLSTRRAIIHSRLIIFVTE